MPRSSRPYWAVSFQSSDRLREEERDAGRHECARGSWCAGRTVTTGDKGERIVSPALTPRVFCDRCDRIIAQSLAEFPALCLKLMFAVRDKLVSDTEIRVPFGPNVPLRVDADHAAWLVADICASWHERIAEVARLSAPDTEVTRRRALTRPVLVAKASAPTLAAHTSTLLMLEPGPMGREYPLLPFSDPPEVCSRHGDAAVVMLSGAHAGNEILTLHYVARAILQETPPKLELLLGIPCRACGHLALRRADPPWNDHDPEFWSSCMHCRDLLDAGEYREWVVRNAAFYRHSMPAQVAEVA